MWSSLRARLLIALIAVPVLVAVAITIAAVHLLREDKERSIYALQAQSAELVARRVHAELYNLCARAALLERASPPFRALRRTQRASKRAVDPVTVSNASAGGEPMLRVSCSDAAARVTFEIAPEALLDLRGVVGPSKTLLVSRAAELLIHPDRSQVVQRRRAAGLMAQLKIFGRGRPRLGTHQVDVPSGAQLAAYARATPSLAVIQLIPAAVVGDAVKPLVTAAVITSLVTVAVAALLALMLGGRVIRPLRAMVRQLEAIGRGEFGVTVEQRSDGSVAAVVESFNEMSHSLQRRDDELKQVQRQLLQAERLNTAARMITAIVKELSAPLDRCLTLAGKTAGRLTDDEEAAGWQREIVEQANRASNILQNLRRIASSETSERRTVEVDLAVADAIVSARPLFDRQQLEVESSLDQASVEVRPDQLHSALLDMLLVVTENAEPATQIQITAHRTETGLVAIELSYRGKGIGTPGERRSLDPFAGQAAEQGELVLAVASMVMREEGGALEVETGEASTKLVATLPVADPSPASV